MPNRTPTPKKTTKERGYGHNHQTTRARLLTRHVDGTKCWWCARPMYKDAAKNWDGKALHADHNDGQPTRTTARRLLHDVCNKQRGDGTRDHQRPALISDTNLIPVDHESLDNLVMDWP